MEQAEMNYSDLELLLLKHIQAENYRPVKPRVITKQLGFPESRRPEVRKAIKRLAKKGAVSYGSNHLVTAQAPAQPKSTAKPTGKSKAKPAGKSKTKPTAKPKQGEVVGIFQRTSSGFGFVKPQSETAKGRSPSDIYIPASRTSDASSGDLVRVRLGRPRRVGDEDKPRGEIRRGTGAGNASIRWHL